MFSEASDVTFSNVIAVDILCGKKNKIKKGKKGEEIQATVLFRCILSLVYTLVFFFF